MASGLGFAPSERQHIIIIFGPQVLNPHGLKTKVKISEVGYESIAAGGSKDKQKAMELKRWMQIDSL